MSGAEWQTAEQYWAALLLGLSVAGFWDKSKTASSLSDPEENRSDRDSPENLERDCADPGIATKGAGEAKPPDIRSGDAGDIPVA